MGKLNPLGKLSGAVREVVFVQLNGKTFVWSKPNKAKQTVATKKAPKAFGWLSAQEKLFRKILLLEYKILTDRTVAYRHRSLLHRILTKLPNGIGSSSASLMLSDFRLLQGFNFNNELLWDNCFRSFIEISPIEKKVFLSLFHL